MDKEKKYKLINRTDLAKGKVELEIEVSAETLSSFRKGAIEAINKDMKIDGFRPGHIPENIVVEKAGEMAITERMAYKAVNNIYPMVIVEEKINPLTNPEITITKIAPGSSLTFKAKVQLIPNIELPDYKKIAKEVKVVDNAEVTEKEIDTYIDFIRSQRAQMLKMNETKKTESENEEEKNSDDKKSEKVDDNLPELNDEFVQSLGDFKTVADFKAEVKKNMQKEKDQKEIERRRLEIIEAIIKETKVDVPDILVNEEIERMLGEFKDRIRQMKMEPDDYFKEIKKTESELKEEWRTDAEKRSKMNLILPKIAQAEKVKVDPELVEKEIAHLKEHHKDLDEFRAKIYISNLLANEEVFKILEKI